MHLPVSGMHSGVSKLELGLNVSHHLPLEEDTCLANFQVFLFNFDNLLIDSELTIHTFFGNLGTGERLDKVC